MVGVVEIQNKYVHKELINLATKIYLFFGGISDLYIIRVCLVIGVDKE